MKSTRDKARSASLYPPDAQLRRQSFNSWPKSPRRRSPRRLPAPACWGVCPQRARRASAASAAEPRAPRKRTTATATKPKAKTTAARKPTSAPKAAEAKAAKLRKPDPAPPAGWQTPGAGSGGNGATDVVSTAVQAAGELAQLGVTIGGQLISGRPDESRVRRAQTTDFFC